MFNEKVYLVPPSSLEKNMRGWAAPEHDLQSTFFAWLSWNEKNFPKLRWFHAIPNGGHRVQSVANKLKREGVKKGVWDTFLPIARGGYHGFYIEFKAPSKTLTDEQKEFRTHLEEEDYAHVMCRTVNDAIGATVAYVEGRFDEWIAKNR